MKRLAWVVMALAALTLAACGGSSSSSGKPNYNGSTSRALMESVDDGADFGAAAVSGMTLAMQPFDDDHEFFPEFIYDLVDDFGDGGINRINTSEGSYKFSYEGGCGGTATGSASYSYVWDDTSKYYRDVWKWNVTFTDYADFDDCRDNYDLRVRTMRSSTARCPGMRWRCETKMTTSWASAPSS